MAPAVGSQSEPQLKVNHLRSDIGVQMSSNKAAFFLFHVLLQSLYTASVS